VTGFIKKRWVLFLVLIIFIICKIPHLSYPYYWDESWPYMPAIREMYKHGVSLMPYAVDPGLSHCHPLFFHAVAATWMHIFGTSHIAMHSFPLFISILLLIAIYEAGLRLFNERVAIMALILVATQVAFFVQSSFVLFEVLVAFLAFLSLYFYVKNKYLLTATFLTALFYTKESGLVAGFVLGIDALAGIFNKNVEWKTRLYRLMSILVPCVLIAIYFIIQKQERGWYISPFYMARFERRSSAVWYNFRRNSLRNSFWEYLKYWYYILLLVLSILAAIKNKSVKYLVFFLPAIVIYGIVDDQRSRILPGAPFFALFVFSIVFLFYILHSLKVYANTRQGKFVVLSGIFIACFFCFTSLNFFTYRYLMAALIPLCFFLPQ